MQIIIQRDGITLSRPRESGVAEFVNARDTALLGERLTDFCVKNGISATAIPLFVAEELLFSKTLDLPLKTPDLKEAVTYQLSLLTPFTEEACLHSFVSVRGKDAYRITLYAVQRSLIDPYIREITGAGYKIAGLYPESQRYVNKACRKIKWALVMPGRFTRVIMFSGAHIEARLLCGTEPDFAELAAEGWTETIYHTSPPAASEFLDARQLSSQPPLLKEYNMLPPVFLGQNFGRPAIIVLLILNMLALAGLAGVKEYRLLTLERHIDKKIQNIMPLVRGEKDLRAREKQLAEDIKRLRDIGRNPDLITFFAKLTKELPESAYLDQMRLNPKSSAIEIQGYTKDLGKLTAKIQALGEAQLKSTTRRRDKTYFIMEINLP